MGVRHEIPRGVEPTVAGLGDLDECNGMQVDGAYGYFITEQYPYIMACLKGQMDATFD
ncbi:YHYH protein [Porticoccaceae bacterium]|nr:YHYH protein [Porticoccaceae bacterium]